MNWLFDMLGLVFSHEFMGPVLFAVLLSAAAGRWYFADRASRRFIQAADARIDALKKALTDDEDPDQARINFAKSSFAVREAMMKTDYLPLVHAWQEFSESIVDEREVPLRNTARPSGFFYRVVPKQRALVFWSNAFVGIGLILTFLGVVYALHTAAEGMQDGASVSDSQAALRQLLTASSAKFFSSIGGLGASLMLRFAESGLQKKLDAKGHLMCDLLEKAMLYTPPQRLAVEQLEELKRQSTQLEKFNTDLAMAIGEQFDRVITPAFGALGASLDSMSDRMSKSLGDSAGQAVEKAASGELRALGQTLEGLRMQLDSLSGHVQGSGEDAARQIRAAGADFAQAANDIRAAFSGLITEVATIGQSMTSDADAARQYQMELLETTRAAHERATTQTSEAVSGAVNALQDAGRTVAADLQTQMGSAMTSAAKEAEGIVRAAIEESGQNFAEAGRSISEAVASAANRIAGLAEAIGQSERRASGTADALLSTADGARAAAEAMNKAAIGFETAASPVASSAKSLQEAAARMAERIEASEKASTEALAALRILASEMNNTQAAASDAWEDYRGRFEGVDKELERVLNQLTETLQQSMQEFRRYSLDVDKNMGAAVSRLTGILEPLNEHSETIAEFAESLKATSSERK